MLAALANPHRLRIIAALATGGRNYVSQLARELGISRPLLHLHLQKLEYAGLVTSRLELSQDGKALNYFEVRSFDFELTPAAIAEAAKSLTAKLQRSPCRNTSKVFCGGVLFPVCRSCSRLRNEIWVCGRAGESAPRPGRSLSRDRGKGRGESRRDGGGARHPLARRSRRSNPGSRRGQENSQGR